ncbi:MAG TPA: ATP-binding cassette domain-containing protein [Gemmatimonadaceae bacterium]
MLDAAFEVPPGVTILFGPSGSEKSTMLAAIAGLVRPDAGRVALGTEVWFDSDRGISVAIAARRLSYVFQSLALFPHMTAAQNVAFGIDRSTPRAQRKQIALEMLERMKVGHLASRRPRTYSGGEAQRVALARAFARSPALVLLDEAFSALDRDLKQELWLDVRGTIEQLGIPAIQVTHQVDEARAMGERMVRMERGRVIETGGVASLRDDRDEREAASMSKSRVCNA